MTDLILLFLTRTLRMFAYGFLSIAIVLYLAKIGLKESEIGLLLTLTLIGDAIISLGLTTTADRLGRRRMLIIGALLMALAGVTFILTQNFILLVLVAIIGIISPSGHEIGPFLAIEQAALSQLLPNEKRTQMFAWYNLVGAFATAVGALVGGLFAQFLHNYGFTHLEAYRALFIGYAGSGILLAILFLQLSAAVEIQTFHIDLSDQHFLGLHRSRAVVLKLSTLFALDAFAGGFVVQSLLAYWLYVRFEVEIGLLGSIFFAANLLAGLSALLAARLAAKIGLINTMVFTHIPSNILLILVPLMPNFTLAITILLIRFSISQMDVPTRQSYTMAVVAPEERSAAAGITNIARSIGASLSPGLTGWLLTYPALLNVPFFLSGGLKVVYDLLLYYNFRKMKTPEELGK